jgi:hypothetical protein
VSYGAAPRKGITNFVKGEPFTATVFDALDDKIRSVSRVDEMITPDEASRTPRPSNAMMDR